MKYFKSLLTIATVALLGSSAWAKTYSGSVTVVAGGTAQADTSDLHDESSGSWTTSTAGNNQIAKVTYATGKAASKTLTFNGYVPGKTTIAVTRSNTFSYTVTVTAAVSTVTAVTTDVSKTVPTPTLNVSTNWVVFSDNEAIVKASIGSSRATSQTVTIVPQGEAGSTKVHVYVQKSSTSTTGKTEVQTINVLVESPVETAFNGGTVTTVGAEVKEQANGDLLLTFKQNGSLQLSKKEVAELLVAGGGGGGGAGSGSKAFGSGGAGATVVHKPDQELAAGVKMNVAVGAGGPGGETESDGENGDSSSFDSFVAPGGAKGTYKGDADGSNGQGSGSYGITGESKDYGKGGGIGTNEDPGDPGEDYTGNGGQGGGKNDSVGGAGGSGVVIVRLIKPLVPQPQGPITGPAITYGQTLADSKPISGTMKAGEKDVAGSFAWKDPATVPAVSDSDTTEYDVIFTPDDTLRYCIVTNKATVTVNKATPTVTAVSATGIKEGQSLADSTVSGTATGVDGNELDGTWAWVDDTIRPLVDDSEKTRYDVTFTPDDGNYSIVATNVTLVVESSVEPTTVDPMPVGGAPYKIPVSGGTESTVWTATISKGADVVTVSPEEFTGESTEFEVSAIAPGAAKVYVRKDGMIVKVYELTVLPTFNVELKATETTSVIFTNVFDETYTDLDVEGDTEIASASWGETEVASGKTAEITITGLQAGKTAALTLKSDGETIGYINATVNYIETELMATGLLTMRDYTIVYTNNEGITLSDLGWTPRPGDEGKATLEFSAEPLEPNDELTVTIHAGGIPANSTLFITNGAATVCSIFVDVDYPATNVAVKMVAGTVVTNLYHNDTGVKLTGINLNAPIEPSGVIESTRFLADDVEKDGDVAYEIVAGTVCGTPAKATFNVSNMEVDAKFGELHVTVVPVATPSIDLFVTESGSVAFTNLTSSVMDELELTSSNPLVATGSLGDVKSIAVGEEIEIGVYALDLTGDATLTLTSRGQVVAQIAVTVGYDQKYGSKTVIAGRPVQFVYENETGAALTNLTASTGVALSDVSIAADGSVSFVIPSAANGEYKLFNNGVEIATYTVTTVTAPMILKVGETQNTEGWKRTSSTSTRYWRLTLVEESQSGVVIAGVDNANKVNGTFGVITGQKPGTATYKVEMSSDKSFWGAPSSVSGSTNFEFHVYETISTNCEVIADGTSVSPITCESAVEGEWVAWSDDPAVAKVTVAEGSTETCTPVITGLTPNATATLHVENDYARYTIEVFVEEPALDPVRETVYVAEDGFAKTVVLTNETASESWTADVSQGEDNADASAQKIDNDFAELTITGKAAGAARVKLRNAADAVQKIYEVVVSPLLTAQMEATKTATVTPAVAFDDVTSDDVAEAEKSGSSITVTGKAVGTTTLLVTKDGVIVSYIDVTVGYTVTELEAISMKTSETKSFTYENNEGIVLTGLTLESDDESVATGLVEVASIGIDAAQSFTVFPAGTPGKTTLTLKSNGNTVATVEVTTAYPVTDKTAEVKTLYGGEKDVTIAYVNDTGFDLNNLKVVSGDKNVATGLVASAVAKGGTATITVFGEAAGTVELTLKNGDETIARYTVFVVPRIPLVAQATDVDTINYVNAFTNTLGDLEVEHADPSVTNAVVSWIAETVDAGKTGTLVYTAVAVGDETLVLKSGDMIVGYVDVSVGYHLQTVNVSLLTTRTTDIVYTNDEGIALGELSFVTNKLTVVPNADISFDAAATIPVDGELPISVTSIGLVGEAIYTLMSGTNELFDIHVDVDYPETNATVKMVANTVVTNLYHNDTGVLLDAPKASYTPDDVVKSATFVGDSVAADEDIPYEIKAGATAGTKSITFENHDNNFGRVNVTVVPVATSSIDLFVTESGSVAFTNLTSSVMDELEVTSSNPLVATGSLGDVKSIAVDEEIEIDVQALDLTGSATLTLTSRGQVVAQVRVTVGYDQKYGSKTVIAGRPVQFVYENETGAALTNLAASSGVVLSDVSIAADGSVSFVIPSAANGDYKLFNNGELIATYTVKTTAAPNFVPCDGLEYKIGTETGSSTTKTYEFQQKETSDIAKLVFKMVSGSTYKADVYAVGKMPGRVTLTAQNKRTDRSTWNDGNKYDILVYENISTNCEVITDGTSVSPITCESAVEGEWVAWSDDPAVAKVTVAEGSTETCKPVITGLTPNETATLHVENDYARYTIEVFVEEPALDPVRETVYVAEDGFAKTVVLTNETASESWTAVVSQGEDNATASAQKIDNDFAELTITGKQVGAARVKLRNAADEVQKIYEVVVSPLLTAEMEATKTATVKPAVAFDDVTSDDVAEAEKSGSSITVTGKAVGTTTLIVTKDGVIVSYIDVTVGYTVTELEPISMKTSETKSFTYENNEGIVLTGLTLESDDGSVATGLVEVASIGIDAAQSFTVFPAGTPGKATLTLKSNGNTVATVEVTTAYPVTDKTDEVKTLYGGEKDVTIAYVNDTGFDLNNLKVVSGDTNVATGLVASAVAKDGTATITVFGETAGTVELTLKNGDEAIARYTVFVVPRIPVTVNASETTNDVEYVNAFTNELGNLSAPVAEDGDGTVATAEWQHPDASIGAQGKGYLDVTGLMATNDVTFVLKSGEMTIGYLDVKVGYHLEEFEPVPLKTSDEPYIFNFTNVQGIALLNFAATSTNAAVAAVESSELRVERDGSVDLTVTPAGAPGETRVEIYDGEYLIGTRVFTTAYPVARGTNTLMVGTSITNVWTNDTGFDLDALTVETSGVALASKLASTEVKSGETVEVEITAGNTAGPALVLLKNNGETVARYGVQVVPILEASVEAGKEVEVTYVNKTGVDLDDLRDAADAIATATWENTSVVKDGNVNLTVKGLQADGTTRLTLKDGATQVVGYVDVTVGWPTVVTNKVALELVEGSGATTFTYLNETGLTLDGLTVTNDNESAVLADLDGVTSVGPNGELVVYLTSSLNPGTATVTVRSGERVISVIVVTAGIKQEEKATANLTLKVGESITYTTFSKSTAWTATSASTTYVTASVQNPTADEPECGKIVITGKTATGNTARKVTITDADGNTKEISVTVYNKTINPKKSVAIGDKVDVTYEKVKNSKSSKRYGDAIANFSSDCATKVNVDPETVDGDAESDITATFLGVQAGDASYEIGWRKSDGTTIQSVGGNCLIRVYEEKTTDLEMSVGRTVETVCDSANPAVWSLDDLGDAADYVDVSLSDDSLYADRVKLTVKAKAYRAEPITFTVRNDYAVYAVTVDITSLYPVVEKTADVTTDQTVDVTFTNETGVDLDGLSIDGALAAEIVGGATSVAAGDSVTIRIWGGKAGTEKVILKSDVYPVCTVEVTSSYPVVTLPATSVDITKTVTVGFTNDLSVDLDKLTVEDANGKDIVEATISGSVASGDTATISITAEELEADDETDLVVKSDGNPVAQVHVSVKLIDLDEEVSLRVGEDPFGFTTVATADEWTYEVSEEDVVSVTTNGVDGHLEVSIAGVGDGTVEIKFYADGELVKTVMATVTSIKPVSNGEKVYMMAGDTTTWVTAITLASGNWSFGTVEGVDAGLIEQPTLVKNADGTANITIHAYAPTDEYGEAKSSGYNKTVSCQLREGGTTKLTFTVGITNRVEDLRIKLHESVSRKCEYLTTGSLSQRYWAVGGDGTATLVTFKKNDGVTDYATESHRVTSANGKFSYAKRTEKNFQNNATSIITAQALGRETIVIGRQYDSGTNDSEKPIASYIYNVTVYDTLTPVSGPTATDITLGQKLSASEISGQMKDSAGNEVEGDWAWVDGSVEPGEGTEFHKATFTATGDNAEYYDVYECEIPVTVVNPLIPIAVPTAVTGLVYNGNEQTGVVENVGFTLTDNVATDAGDYTATATLADGYIWEDGSSDPTNINWSIAKAQVTVTAEDADKLLGEGDPEFTATVKGLFGDDEIVYEVARTNASEEVGIYDLVATGDAEQGSYDVTYVGGTFEIRAGWVTVTIDGETKGYDDVDEAFAALLEDGGTAVFNAVTEYDITEYAHVTIRKGSTLVVGEDGSWTFSGEHGTSIEISEIPAEMNLAVNGTLCLFGDVFIGGIDADDTVVEVTTLLLDGVDVVVGQEDDDVDETDAKAILTFENFVCQTPAKLILTTNGVVRSMNATPLVIADVFEDAPEGFEIVEKSIDGGYEYTLAELPKTFDITIAIMDCVTDVETNGESVVGTLTLPADATEVELELVSTNTIPIFKFSKDGGSTWSVTNKTPVIAVAAGDTLTFMSEEAKMDDPTVTPKQAKQAIIDAIDEENREVVAPKIEAVVDTAETPAPNKVSAKDMAKWITDNTISSSDMAESDYLVASVRFDTEKPITDENTEVEFTEVAAATSDEFVFYFELDIDDDPQVLTLVKEYVAGCIQTTGDLGTGFKTTVDASRVTVDSETGKVTIIPDQTKSAEFFRIVIPKDPGAK